MVNAIVRVAVDRADGSCRGRRRGVYDATERQVPGLAIGSAIDTVSTTHFPQKILPDRTRAFTTPSESLVICKPSLDDITWIAVYGRDNTRSGHY